MLYLHLTLTSVTENKSTDCFWFPFLIKQHQITTIFPVGAGHMSPQGQTVTYSYHYWDFLKKRGGERHCMFFKYTYVYLRHLVDDSYPKGLTVVTENNRCWVMKS